MLVGNLRRWGKKCSLLPSLTVRSSGGLFGLLSGRFGMLRRGAEPVNQMSGRAFGPGLTVARHRGLELLGNLGVWGERMIWLIEGSFIALCGADRERLDDSDISLDA